MAKIPPANGSPVSFRTIPLRDFVLRQWGPEFYRPDTGYIFSNGRRFDTSDQGRSGIYGPLTITDRILFSPLPNDPNNPPSLLQEDGTQVGQDD